MRGSVRFALLQSRVFVLAACAAFAQDDALRRAAQLDAEQKCAEAEHLYDEMLAGNVRSAPLLNNAGNHYLVCGQPERAEALFLQLTKQNPAHVNANFQLARIATQRRDGSKALQFLSYVPDSS